jgi:hypothetical protein
MHRCTGALAWAQRHLRYKRAAPKFFYFVWKGASLINHCMIQIDIHFKTEKAANIGPQVFKQ